VVLVTGLPGTGKSTVAEAVARRTGASLVGWDWAMAALTGFDEVQAALLALDRPTYRSVGWSLALQHARQQLRVGRPAVLDGVARDVEVGRVRALGEECDVDTVVLLTTCGDERLHRQRIEGRTRGIPGWHELSWDDVVRTRRRFVEPTDVDLVLDSTKPVEELVDAVLHRIGR
jgi:predicted kinase